MSYNSIDTTKREIYIDFDYDELNSDGTFGSSNNPVKVAMVPSSQVSVTKTALGTPLEIQNGTVITVTDNIKPGLLEAYRGNSSMAPSQYYSYITYPALTKDQILIVLDEKVQLQNVANADQFKTLFDVKLESQPNSAINPSQFSAEAFDEQRNVSTLSNAVNTRMIIVTLTNPINEAVSVSIRSNSLWDGNKDVNGFNILNDAFETSF
jgi:hypothetical protein